MSDQVGRLDCSSRAVAIKAQGVTNRETGARSVIGDHRVLALSVDTDDLIGIPALAHFHAR